jgi:lipopolysaccharide transport system ATP-binding protein
LNNPVTELLSGQTYTFRLQYDNQTQENIDKIIVDMDINDERDRTWLLFRTNFSSISYNLNPGKNIIRCTIEDFPLSIGQYHFSVYTSFSDAEVLDFITHVNHFKVIGGDFFGTGSFGTPANCRLLTRVKWS